MSTTPGLLKETLLDKVTTLHLELLYFNGNERRSLNDNQSILHAFVHKSKQNVVGRCLVSLKVAQTIDKHSAMTFSLFPFTEEADDPACIPIFWISKWVDYSDKYGLGKTPLNSDSNSMIHRNFIIKKMVQKLQQKKKKRNFGF